MLEGFQAGLSWLTILKKRENFRRAFHDFDAARIARYGEKDIARLMADAGIVRNKLKVEATIANAQALLQLQERTSLAAFLWGLVDGRPQINAHSAVRDGAGPDAGLQGHVQGAAGARASASSAPPRSMPSCRPSAWSTIT